MKHFLQVFESLVSAIVLKVMEMFCICNRLCITIERAALFQQDANYVQDQMTSCDGSGDVKNDNGDSGGSDSNGVSSSGRCTIV